AGTSYRRRQNLSAVAEGGSSANCGARYTGSIIVSIRRTTMDFGIFYEIQVNSPLKHREREYQVFHEVLKQVDLAEQVGFSHFWTVEHHFQTGFAHSSAPEVLYGAMSQRSSAIRIGHAVVLLPFPYKRP